jgi:hypothetical protein
MKLIETNPALGGILNPFRRLVKDSKKITFVGSAGFCLPFAELLSYVIAKEKKDIAFVPNLDYEKAKKMVFTPYGIQLSENADPRADTVVLLGGLALPNSGVNVDDMISLIDRITDGKGLKIGVCFMKIFERSGWLEKIDFDYVINSNIENELWGGV